MPISGTASRLAAFTVIMSVAGTGAVASAQLPGVTPGQSVVVVDDTTIQVAVDAPDLVAGTVGVTLQNNSGTSITCNGIKGDSDGTMTRGGTVTTTEIVARTVDYYADNLHTYDGTLPVSVGSGNLGMDITVGLGSVTDLVPGSLTGGLRPEFGEAGRLSELYTEARLNGLVGPVSSVTVPARSGTTMSVVLGPSSTGERPTDFRPAAVFACQRDGHDYLYSGYFGTETPTIPLGSIASSETGRFGS